MNIRFHPWVRRLALFLPVRWFVVAAAALGAGTAGATFHLFVMTQVYSNASGTVQYVMLQTSSAQQQFLTGHKITASQGAGSASFTFTSDLPGNTTNKKFLVATQGFADLHIVTPDYIVPNGFLFLPGGSINYAGVDQIVYQSMPTDGSHAMDRNGNAVVPSPTNFAGATGTISVVTGPDCLFNWAEGIYPQYFAPPGAASATSPPYYYRFYPGTQNYLATSVADNHVWVEGPSFGNGPLDVGPVANFWAPSGCSP